MCDLGILRLKEGVERGDFNYLKLYFQYMYGKPREIKEVTVFTEQPLFDLEISLNKKTLCNQELKLISINLKLKILII